MPCRLSLVVLACLLLAGCGTPPQSHPPAASVRITLHAAQKFRQLRLGVGTVIAVTLPAVTTPSHSWQIAVHDSRYLKQLPTKMPTRSSHDDGTTIEFQALTPGRTRLRFLLEPVIRVREVVTADYQELVVDIE